MLIDLNHVDVNAMPVHLFVKSQKEAKKVKEFVTDGYRHVKNRVTKKTAGLS